MRDKQRTACCAMAILSLASGALADQLTVPSPEYPTIGAAVAAAVSGDEILLLDGVFEGAGNWDVQITVPLTIRSASGNAAAVVIQGPDPSTGTDTGTRAFAVAASTELIDLTVRGFSGVEGAAVLVEGTEIAVRRCRFERNQTIDQGDCDPRLGGAIAGRLASSVTIDESVFDRNSAIHEQCTSGGSAKGGAIHVEGGTLTIRSTLFIENRAAGQSTGAGGAIHAVDCMVDLIGCTVLQSTASGRMAVGGGIQIDGGTHAVIESTIIGNNARSVVLGAPSAAEGGGIAAHGRVSLVGVFMRSNMATSSGTHAIGGGLRTLDRLDAANVVLYGNTARIDARCEAPGAMALGGGAYLAAPSEMAHATIIFNVARCDGDEVHVAEGGSLSLRNSILRGRYSGSPIDALYSNVSGDLPGEGNIDADPRYFGLGRLASGSPGVDAGSVAFIPPDAFDLDGDGDRSEPLPVDRGVHARRIDDPATLDTGVGPAPIPDMGAYETPVCLPDIDGDGMLTVFDFLAFQNAFDAGDRTADFDVDGFLSIFDFLAFQTAFDAGCA